MLSQAGVYTHLASDHYHYWEDGGATYHSRYDSWQFFRGQEGDPHIGQVAEPHIPKNINGKSRRSDWVNRMYVKSEADLPQSQTARAGLEFIERNRREDSWFLQIECFDPHEPFVSDRKYEDLYPEPYEGALFDWPGYQPVTETPEEIDGVRRKYAALLSKCDATLGDVLDAFDRFDLWKDTMLIVWTDHGFLLGEHDAWAKNWMPLYEEVAHTPFFVWDPREPGTAGQHRRALVQPSLDLGPTLLNFFRLSSTQDMRGKDLTPVIKKDEKVREAALFGYHGRAANVTDGRYVYMREPVFEDEGPIFTYTLIPLAMRNFKVGAQTEIELAGPLSFSKGTKVMRFGRETDGSRKGAPGHKLFDLDSDPHQSKSLSDPETEQRLSKLMVELMRDCSAPEEQYIRLGL
jgi:arylsulfatase A-like enzyme